MGSQHGANIHQQSIKNIQKNDRFLHHFFIDFLMIFEGSDLQFLMTLSAKTVIFDISVYMDFDWFLINFWGYLGPQTLPKINKKILKKQVNFDINFYWILDGFWRGLGGQDGFKINEKSIKKRYQQNDRKMSPKQSRKVMQVYARKGGGGVL